MLPALRSDRLSLADVFPSCLAALRGEPNALDLPPVRAAVVLLVDGLGAAALKARAGHARTLAAAAVSMDSGFPTTTASAIATLATGTLPGQHGIVGYTVVDPAQGRLVNQLSGWEGIDPVSWQPIPTVFERAKAIGFRTAFVAPDRYRDSPYTRAVLRGADFVGAGSIADRVEATHRLLSTPGAAQLIYVYANELDKVGHAHGWESEPWTATLERIDGAVRDLVLPHDAGLIVTSDHGVVDVPPHGQIVFDTEPRLMAGIAHVGGEPRCLQLYFAPDTADAVRDTTITAWRSSEGARSWVLTRDEAIAAGWFGAVRPEVVGRIGDLVVAARKAIAYYPGAASERSRAMVGQHGSWSAAELQVPLVRLGAFAGRTAVAG